MDVSTQDKLADAFAEHRQRLSALAKKKLNPILLKRMSEEDVLSETYVNAAKRLDYLAAHDDVPVYYKPRYVASPDINTEDFQAAVDYLISRDDVDADRIGILGICGWGGLAINAAAIDTRVKATVASTMYDMTRVIANGYNDSEDSAAARKAKREAMNAQRIVDLKAGKAERAGGVIDPLPADAPRFVKDYHAYYKTPRGYHPRSLNSTDGWNKTSALSFLNAKLFAYADEIESAVMVVHGEKAHSRYFGETAYRKLKGDNKELVIVPGANHCDLYDGGGKNAIPFDSVEAFYRKNLK